MQCAQAVFCRLEESSAAAAARCDSMLRQQARTFEGAPAGACGSRSTGSVLHSCLPSFLIHRSLEPLPAHPCPYPPCRTPTAAFCTAAAASSQVGSAAGGMAAAAAAPALARRASAAGWAWEAGGEALQGAGPRWGGRFRTARGRRRHGVANPAPLQVSVRAAGQPESQRTPSSPSRWGTGTAPAEAGGGEGQAHRRQAHARDHKQRRHHRARRHQRRACGAWAEGRLVCVCIEDSA